MRRSGDLTDEANKAFTNAIPATKPPGRVGSGRVEPRRAISPITFA